MPILQQFPSFLQNVFDSVSEFLSNRCEIVAKSFKNCYKSCQYVNETFDRLESEADRAQPTYEQISDYQLKKITWKVVIVQYINHKIVKVIASKYLINVECSLVDMLKAYKRFINLASYFWQITHSNGYLWTKTWFNIWIKIVMTQQYIFKWKTSFI